MSNTDAAPPSEGLTDQERAELADLRAEVARLREQPSQVATPGRSSRAWRWIACGLIFTLAAFAILGAVVSRYARSQVLDTDRYVATVTPIGSDPAIKAQITDLATNAIMNSLDVEAQTAALLTSLAANTSNLPPLAAAQLPQLAPMIAGAAENLVRQAVDRVVTGDAFETVWVQANRIAHTNLVSVLTGEGATAITANSNNGVVTLNLGPIIDQVKTQLVTQGMGFANAIPAINPTFTIFQSADIVKAQQAVRILDRLADVLPWIALALAALGVWVAPRGGRRRAITVFGVVTAATMLLLGMGVNLGRSAYLAAVPTDVLSRDAATALIDPLLQPLRWMLRAVLILGLATAIAGYLTGASASALAIRRTVSGWTAQVRGRDRVPTSVEVWVGRYRRPLQVLVLLIGALVFVSWTYPSGAVVGWIAGLTGLGVLVIYAVGAPPQAGHPEIATQPPNRSDRSTTRPA